MTMPQSLLSVTPRRSGCSNSILPRWVGCIISLPIGTMTLAQLEVRQLKAPKALEMAPGYSMKFVNLQWLAVCQQEKSSSGFFLSIYDLSTEDMCEVVCFRRLEYG
eukprot:Selendium_serpulae@DN4414_c0_g1_i4.p2